MRKLLIVVLLTLSVAGLTAYTSTATRASVPVVQQDRKPDVKVWVNTSSKVYHCPGTRWYGKTKVGEYMTQKQAQEKGYRPAYGKVCE
jgi:hypothetical protein